MVFSNINFIFIFLPIFLTVYFLTPITAKYGLLFRNLVLLVGSLIFYAVGEPVYVFLMIFSIVLNYCLAISLDYYEGKEAYVNRRRFLFILGLVINVGILFAFKYVGFFLRIFNQFVLWLSGKMGVELVTLAAPEIVMPIGISFYTFQILSYLIDVYRKKYKAEKNIISLGAYITMFPQLIAGPIVNYPEVAKSMRERHVSPLQFDRGIKDFILGLSAKVLLANVLGTLWSQLNTIGYESISTPLSWLGALAYTLQIYFDFWGYSMMAIGLGEMLGFRIPENFNDPYSSRSATEFWQRWHMTLGRWFREYIYIPMGGNRAGKIKLLRNMFVVWLLTGLWHGADWNFIIWGLGYFVILGIEKLFLKKYLDRSHVISRIYTMFIVIVSWVIFAIDDLKKLGVYLSRMFPFIRMDYVSNVNALDYVKYGKQYGIFFLFGIVLCIPKVRGFIMKCKTYPVANILFFILFFYSVYQLALGLDNPFLYFRF